VRLRIGTSGWLYPAWRGILYERGVPQARWLEAYAEAFSTVELNNAFYRLPTRTSFEGWADRTHDGFTFAVKASRYLTHIRRLRDPTDPVRRLVVAAIGLGDPLGPILLQLPPTLRVDVERLDACLEALPAGWRVAVEPRHASWWADEVRACLVARGAALCWADRLGRPVTPLWRTADWGYVRLHEGRARPRPRYGDAALRTWLRRIREAWPPDADVFVYFNNDPGGAAVVNARRMEVLAAAGSSRGRPSTSHLAPRQREQPPLPSC
jgi:uncharacterized protein YecE (DUF72 family)